VRTNDVHMTIELEDPKSPSPLADAYGAGQGGGPTQKARPNELGRLGSREVLVLVLPEVRGLERVRGGRRQSHGGALGLSFRSGEQRGQIDERGSFLLQLGHLRVRTQDPHLRRAEIHEHGDSVLDADNPAETVHVVGDLVADGEVLGRGGDRGFEGTGGQVTLRCSRLCHPPQYAPTAAPPAPSVQVPIRTRTGYEPRSASRPPLQAIKKSVRTAPHLQLWLPPCRPTRARCRITAPGSFCPMWGMS
jgi:hypothetical protein